MMGGSKVSHLRKERTNIITTFDAFIRDFHDLFY